jgi:Protein of unknown function (DUF2510)
MTTPSAGWYPDPGGSGQLRWFDGISWTSHLARKPTGSRSWPWLWVTSGLVAFLLVAAGVTLMVGASDQTPNSQSSSDATAACTSIAEANATGVGSFGFGMDVAAIAQSPDLESGRYAGLGVALTTLVNANNSGDSVSDSALQIDTTEVLRACRADGITVRGVPGYPPG